MSPMLTRSRALLEAQRGPSKLNNSREGGRLPPAPPPAPSSSSSMSSEGSLSLQFFLPPVLTRSPEHHVVSSRGEEPESPGSASSICSSTTTASWDSPRFSSEEDEPEAASWREADCSTPRAQEFRIPASDLCPPAPRKRKATSARRPLCCCPNFLFVPDFEVFIPLENSSLQH